MPVMKINNCLNCGIAHEWVFDGLNLKELREVKKLTGLTTKGFAEAGDEGDPEAIAALIYVMHKLSKINIPFDDVNLDFTDFSMEPTEDELAAMKEAGIDVDGSDPKE